MDSLRAAWPAVLDAVARKKPSLESLLAAARPELTPEGSLRVICANEFQRSQIAGNLPLLTEIVLDNLGPVPVSCALDAAPAAAPAAPAPRPAPAAVEDAEEASSEEEPSAGDEEEDAPSAPAPARPAAPAEEWSSAAVPADAAEAAALDPGLKKVLDRFPGKLKRLETA
jgi:hypothetical protein